MAREEQVTSAWGTVHAPVHGCLVPLHAQTYEQHWKNKGFARWLSGFQALIQALAECCAQPCLNICVILQAVPAMHNAGLPMPACA